MEFILLRILKGRLPFRRGDLSLYIEEPDQDLMYSSMEIYEKTYDEAYSNEVMIKEEMEEFLFTNEFWTPFDDAELEKIKKENEELKLQAFKNFFRKRELGGIKSLLRLNEKKYSKIANKKHQFDHLTCDGVASYARWNWIIEHSTYFSNGDNYNWKTYDVSSLLSYYESSSISTKNFRAVARSDEWRPIWNLGKKTGDVFGKPAYLLTRDQLLLCSFSTMYDNVYENPEAPDEKIIDDDDCLDGWFIDQKRKNEKLKKEQQANSVISNSKIANASEVFVMASSAEEAESIHGLNSFQGEMTRKNRLNTIKDKGVINNDLEFADIRQELIIQQNQTFANHVKGK